MRPSALLASTLLAGSLALPALAQTATPAAPPAAAATPQAPSAAPPTPAPTPVPDAAKADAARERTAAADRDAMFEAHLAALHAGLTFTADQDRMWPSVEQAMRGLRTMRMEMRERHRAMARDAGGNDEDPMAALKAYGDGLLERGQALKALSDAASPLYASLTDDQKHRLPMLLHGLAPEHGPLARMIERLGDEDHRPDAAMTDEPGPRHHRWDREGRDWGGGMEERGWRRHAWGAGDAGPWRHHHSWDHRGEGRGPSGGEDDDRAMN